jgi:hypothetical protein
MIQELQYNVMWCYSTPKSQLSSNDMKLGDNLGENML